MQVFLHMYARILRHDKKNERFGIFRFLCMGCKCKCKCKRATCVKILALALAGSVHLLSYHNLARCDSILFILEEDIEERTVGLR